MKKLYLISFVLLLLCNNMTVLAYERQLVQEGKQWNFVRTLVHYYVHEKDSCTITKENYTLILQGDTTIAGQQCVKMYEWYRDKGTKVYKCALYENASHQVYTFDEGYDEALEVPYGSPFSKYSPRYKVTTDTIAVASGQEFERYHFVHTGATPVDEPIERWIDGVGSMGGPLKQNGGNARPNCYCDYYTMEFVSCELPGEWIVTAEDFKKETFTNDIVLPEKEASVTPSYDLSGRRADGKKPGVYIRGGKKFVKK